MVEEVANSIYRIEVPLSGNPLKWINSYAIKGQGRSLVIDTGWNRDECKDALLSGLKKIGVGLERTDFFITHSHSDHMGLVSEIPDRESTVYFNGPDAERVRLGFPWDEFVPYARLNGFPEEEIQAVLKSHPGFRYKPEGLPPFRIVKDGDTIEAGSHRFQCVETPGHTRGHMCLYDPVNKMLISGDHILGDISPNLQLWSDEWDPLSSYLFSLEKVMALDVEIVLPGHRNPFRNCRERIEELKEHHHSRSEEILSILRDSKLTAFEITSQMHWDIVCDSWDMFPVSQKWFATGEALAHLKFLEGKGLVKKEVQNGKRIYYRA